MYGINGTAITRGLYSQPLGIVLLTHCDEFVARILITTYVVSALLHILVTIPRYTNNARDNFLHNQDVYNNYGV